MMKLLAISGSLRKGSSNTRLIQAAPRLAPRGVEIHVYDGLQALPHFNPDLDESIKLPRQAAALRNMIAKSDGLILSSPEYAHGIPGTLKNALDWLVGSLDFASIPVALWNLSPRSLHAPAQLREVLTTMAAVLLEPADINWDAASSVAAWKEDGQPGPELVSLVQDSLWTFYTAAAPVGRSGAEFAVVHPSPVALELRDSVE